MIKQSLKKGFTLIELLVVIAIIGILAAIVLTSLGNARDGARDASAKGSMNSVRNEAELFFGDNDSYAGVCTDASITRLLDAADDQAGADVCNDSAGAYAAEIDLNNGDLFCVDSTGFAGEPGAALATSTTVCQ